MHRPCCWEVPNDGLSFAADEISPDPTPSGDAPARSEERADDEVHPHERTGRFRPEAQNVGRAFPRQDLTLPTLLPLQYPVYDDLVDPG
jgi:hypothetical protein